MLFVALNFLFSGATTNFVRAKFQGDVKRNFWHRTVQLVRTLQPRGSTFFSKTRTSGFMFGETAPTKFFDSNRKPGKDYLYSKSQARQFFFRAYDRDGTEQLQSQHKLRSSTKEQHFQETFNDPYTHPTNAQVRQ